MSADNGVESMPLDKKAILGKGGPVAGSALSLLGNLLVLIGFVLPWASCNNYQISGLDIFTQSASGELGDANGILLGMIPFLAIGMLGVAILTIPASLVKKIPSFVKAICMALVVLLTACACLPACLFFTNMQTARNDPGSFGLGGFVQIEYGFWMTMAGLFVSLLGGLLGLGTSVAERLLSRKKPAEAPKTEERLPNKSP